MKDDRRCVSCRKVAPRAEFWRIVRQHPDHQVVLDQGMGRSVYLCPHPDCLKASRRKDRLSRALKKNVDDEIYQVLSDRLDQAQPSTIDEENLGSAVKVTSID
ncbi:MAG: hypothetical protein RLZZ511_873 [Cyanobacteriota bacterium]|jgi:predicted RNA-binding protein YlxR (DUF448 family)